MLGVLVFNWMKVWCVRFLMGWMLGALDIHGLKVCVLGIKELNVWCVKLLMGWMLGVLRF